MFILRRNRRDGQLTYPTETETSTATPRSTLKSTLKNRFLEQESTIYNTSSSSKSQRQKSKFDHIEDHRNSVVDTYDMNTNVRDGASTPDGKVYRYTGFPEPFNHDRNTTLPHPEADTSPNPVLEAPDFNLVRSHSKLSLRHRQQSNNSNNSHTNSFRHPLNRGRNSGGSGGGISIGSNLSAMYDDMQQADKRKDKRSRKEIEREADDEGRDEMEMEMEMDMESRARGPNDSGVDMGIRDEEKLEGYKTEEKKKGVLGKLGL